ncbi:hypothetical protein [Cognatishimia sp. MH4019]|uniref:hypothetical protein n=1 Tax=Cognatishimia sp. MH4019 TaxID=2854030 RepID=UPI001CD76777|nr:hypothetical protein [Cognatishimia sp. MH4019]
MAKLKQAELEQDSTQDAVDFFDQMGTDEVGRFLRTLPVIATNDGEPFSMQDLTYEALLQPYILHAWKAISGSPGIPGRIKQLTDVYKAAEAALERDTGRKRRVSRVIDLPRFMDAYASRGLPL